MRHRRRESSPLKAPQGSSLKNSIFLEKIQFGPELNNNTERDRLKKKNIHNDGEEKMYTSGALNFSGPSRPISKSRHFENY